MKLELKHLDFYSGSQLKGVRPHITIEGVLENFTLKKIDKKSDNLYGATWTSEFGYDRIGPSIKPVLRRIESITEERLLSDDSYLRDNHFDVFGLIEQGLAIDINTLSMKSKHCKEVVCVMLAPIPVVVDKVFNKVKKATLPSFLSVILKNGYLGRYIRVNKVGDDNVYTNFITEKQLKLYKSLINGKNELDWIEVSDYVYSKIKRYNGGYLIEILEIEGTKKDGVLSLSRELNANN